MNSFYPPQIFKAFVVATALLLGDPSIAADLKLDQVEDCEVLAEKFEASAAQELAERARGNRGLELIIRNMVPYYTGLDTPESRLDAENILAGNPTINELPGLPAPRQPVLQRVQDKLAGELQGRVRELETENTSLKSEKSKLTSQNDKLTSDKGKLEAKLESISREKVRNVRNKSENRPVLGNSPACFLSDTPIVYKKAGTDQVSTTTVSQVTPGDRLLSYFVWENDGKEYKSGELCWDRVIRTIQKELPSDTRELHRIQLTQSGIEKRNLIVTGKHRFFVTEQGEPNYIWKTAETLTAGLRLFTPLHGELKERETLQVAGVQDIAPSALTISPVVVNFTTERTHTYFVGSLDSATLVHNLK